MSDFSDSDIEADDHIDIFTQATEYVERRHDKLMPNDLLELYGLYKQATVGPVNTAKPGIFNMQGRAKWSAWHDLGQMPAAEAKRLYAEKVRKLDPEWYADLESGAKQPSRLHWVVHSIIQPPDNLDAKPERDKNAFDYIKEVNLVRLRETLNTTQLQQLDEQGMGLVHWAADRNAVEILKLLLNMGADVNMRDGEQQTALHYAASCGNMECINVLLENKADRFIKDGDGQTCLDVAEDAAVRTLLEN